MTQFVLSQNAVKDMSPGKRRVLQSGLAQFHDLLEQVFPIGNDGSLLLPSEDELEMLDDINVNMAVLVQLWKGLGLLLEHLENQDNRPKHPPIAE